MTRTWPLCCSAALLLLAAGPTSAATPSGAPVTQIPDGLLSPAAERPHAELKLADTLASALDANLSLRVKVRNLDAARFRFQASHAPWMPYLTTSWNYQPSRSERWFDQYKSWERTRGNSANYAVGLGAAAPTGTTFSVGWAQGTFNRFTEYDPEIVIENPLDPDNPIPVLVSNEFHTRWSALTLTLNQNLLEGISPGYQLRALREAGIGVDVAAIEQRREMATVVSDVLGAYWDLAAGQRNLAIARANLDLANRQREVTAARIDAGELAPIELLRIDETAASRSADVLEAQRAADEAEGRLKLLMGLEMTDPLAASHLDPVDGVTMELPARETEASMRVALSQNLDLKLQKADLEAKQIRWRADRHTLLPVLDLRASLALNGTGFDSAESVRDVFDRNFPELQVGMDFRIPLPDIGAIGTTRASAAEVEASLLSIADAERRALAGVESAQRSIESYDKQVEVAAVRIRFAERTAEAAEATYAAGRNTLREVLEAQQALKEARQTAVAARVQALRARVELEVLRGTLLDTLGVEIE